MSVLVRPYLLVPVGGRHLGDSCTQLLGVQDVHVDGRLGEDGRVQVTVDRHLDDGHVRLEGGTVVEGLHSDLVLRLLVLPQRVAEGELSRALTDNEETRGRVITDDAVTNNTKPRLGGRDWEDAL